MSNQKGTIGVIGPGTMGAGLAQLAAQKGFKVILVSHSEESVKKGLGRITGALGKLAEKGKISEDDKNAALANVTTAASLDALKGVPVVVESIAEIHERKVKMLKELEEVVDEKTIIATNTSSLSVDDLAAVLKHPGRFIGMHFFNPVPLMKLVEIIVGHHTSVDTLKTIESLCEELEKTGVQVKDSPGFIVNNLLIPIINNAAELYSRGVATREAIDEAMKLGANHPIGPLALGDLIGLDVCLEIMRNMHDGLKDDRFKPASLLEEKVTKGELGRKTKKGFYEY